MVRLALLTAATTLVMAPAGHQQLAADLPVHASLRLAGDRTSFKSGEPIRLHLALTADRPGFVVDTDHVDEASDVLDVTPEAGVFRLPKYGWRDVMTPTKLSDVPVVLDVAANYWVRFDQSGDYRVAMQIRRVSAEGSDGHAASSTRMVVSTNAVTFHVDLPTETEEQQLVDGAVLSVQNSLRQRGEAQERAAEALAFLAGDSAAIEKHREYRAAGAAGVEAANAREVIRRGFYVSRHPMLIVDLFERELADLARPATPDLIADAAILRLWAENPGGMPSVPFLPSSAGGTSPESILRARYVDEIHNSLPNRRGESKLQSAMTILNQLGSKTPDDVLVLIADNFSQFSTSDQTRLATQYWPRIKTPQLGSSLLAMLPKVDGSSRQALLKSLVDLSPALAHDPIEAELRDEASLMGASSVGDLLLRAFPDDAFRSAGPAIVARIRELLAAPTEGPASFRLQMKASLLPRVVGPELAADVRSIYGQFGDRLHRDTKAYFLAYLLRWDADVSGGVVETAIRTEKEDPGWLLYRISETAYSPKIDAIVKERLLSDSASDASSAAGILGRRGQPQDRALIEDRLARLQAELRVRQGGGADITEIKDAYEPQFIAVLVGSRRWTLTAADRDRLLASCVTKACRDTFGLKRELSK